MTRLETGPVQNKSYTPLIGNPEKDKEAEKIRKLKKQVRRERKGAERELRKDSAFIEAERMKKQRAFENEREEKRRKIMNELNQERNQQKKNEKFIEKMKDYQKYKIAESQNKRKFMN